jgi:SAM-dependent methyltransferase
VKTTQYYDQQSALLASQYNAINPERVHQSWKALLEQQQGGLACDIGAGSGRDARWLASRGWEVVAVEPSTAMRETGEAYTQGQPVTWMNDALPGLQKLRNVGYRFNLILLSAVWQHVPPGERQRAFRVLANLLKPGGHLVISLRKGSDEAENRVRQFYPVSAEELQSLAARHALIEAGGSDQEDPRRPHVCWLTRVFRLPDDGTGSLSLLRHIIVNDDKASSYKLGLLRVLAKIAETQPGAVTGRNEDWTEIPLGLIAFFWLKQYKPLILTHRLPVGASRGVGFAKDDFYRLADWSDYDLHVGSSFSAERGAVLTRALRDACHTIVHMPTRYITWPGQNRPVFEAERRSVRVAKLPLTIDLPYLSSFGCFRVPSPVWQALGTYACWIEPVVIREWVALTRRWQVSEYRAPDPGLFAWESQQRFTGVARSRMQDLRESGENIRCVWSKARSRTLDIDHCFPWARWQNNDLWNLLPAAPAVNRAKSDKLPSRSMFDQARADVARWWETAYLDTPLEKRFFSEASLALPNLDSQREKQDLDAIFDALLHQRARLKSDQQLADWDWN